MSLQSFFLFPSEVFLSFLLLIFSYEHWQIGSGVEIQIFKGVVSFLFWAAIYKILVAIIKRRIFGIYG